MFAYACVSECMYVVLPNLICYNPQQVSILKLRPTWRPSGNRAPAPQISMLRQGRAKDKKLNTHTSCINIEIWGAGTGDPHKFRFENLRLSIESCGWSSFNITRPGVCVQGSVLTELQPIVQCKNTSTASQKGCAFGLYVNELQMLVTRGLGIEGSCFVGKTVVSACQCAKHANTSMTSSRF